MKTIKQTEAAFTEILNRVADLYDYLDTDDRDMVHEWMAITGAIISLESKVRNSIKAENESIM